MTPPADTTRTTGSSAVVETTCGDGDKAPEPPPPVPPPVPAAGDGDSAPPPPPPPPPLPVPCSVSVATRTGGDAVFAPRTHNDAVVVLGAEGSVTVADSEMLNTPGVPTPCAVDRELGVIAPQPPASSDTYT